MAAGVDDPNENSVVLTVEYGGFRALLTGDAGLPVESLRATAIGDVAVLKVGHHGSRSATGAAWLAAVRPEVCVLSVGDNRYGHPHPAVLERLGGAGCATWRTDRTGDVRVESDGRTVRVSAGDRDTVFTVTQEQP
jgi:competence protein ComEC